MENTGGGQVNERGEFVRGQDAPKQETPTSKDLVEKAEKRKLELKRLTSEEYAKRWENLEDTIDKCSKDFGEVNYSNSQIEGMTKHAFEKISKALEEGDLTAAQQELADLKEYKEKMDIHRNMHPDAVRAIMTQVHNFIEYFGLDKHVILRNNMDPDDIKRAINLGYEAKMYELQNRLED